MYLRRRGVSKVARCMRVRMYIRTYVCAYICAYVHMYVRTYVHTYMHTYVIITRTNLDFHLGTGCFPAGPGGGCCGGGSRPWGLRAGPPGVCEHPLRRPARAFGRLGARIGAPENSGEVIATMAVFPWLVYGMDVYLRRRGVSKVARCI